MSCSGPRDSEIELLKSMFQPGEELIFEDTEGLDSWMAENQRTIGFVLKLREEVELTVHLPPGYPSGDSTNPVLPSVTIRLLPCSKAFGVNERILSSRFNTWLEEVARTGEPVVCSAIEWIQSELEAQQLGRGQQNSTDPAIEQLSASADPPHLDAGDAEKSIVCLWIVSHHIRSPIKRRLILEWAAELNLTGCCMPGRPGLVIAEGEAHKADEYWSRLRNLQWKHIQLRDREVIGKEGYRCRRFPDGFEELFLAHQSRFQWLNQRGVSSDQFKLVFGIPGRLPQGAEVHKRHLWIPPK
ncbi:hypothetical protein CRM22_009576 [Opisthorchis felineus]|uniref:RWD domain-containing protein n=1 Tax=Opisthorchis felineus TaxID=147828 RepID=A0A4S2L719_OPIFE|nr:hypothetical protein CRM22_009576 [Opisthorchis felineus]